MPHARAIETATPDGPRVASSIVTGIRRLLMEEGRWDAVRAAILAREPGAREWIDAPLTGTWYPLERHLLLMSALLDVVGEPGIRELGRVRLRETMSSGVLAPLLRSWSRSYSGAPSQLLRVTPHAWAAATRGLGRMEVRDTGDRELTLEIRGAPEAVRRGHAWQRFLEGYGLGVLELGNLEGDVAIVPTADGLSATFRWARR